MARSQLGPALPPVPAWAMPSLAAMKTGFSTGGFSQIPDGAVGGRIGRLDGGMRRAARHRFGA